MGKKKRHVTDEERENYASEKKRQRRSQKALLSQWRKMDFSKESFILPESSVSNRYPTFIYRNSTLLRIFLKFVTNDLVSQIAKDLDPQEDLTTDNGDAVSLSLPQIYKMLAIWIRIYGEQHQPPGVKKGGRPLRYQLQWYAKDFADNFPHIPNAGGIRFIERFTTHFLFDSRYSKQLSHNFRTIFFRSIGLTIAGDEKLLHFKGIVTYISIISFLYT